MLLECQNCGAPLDVQAQASVVRCNYCGMSNQVGTARTVAPQTPPGWRPPPVWTPPQHFPALSQPITYSRAASGAPMLMAIVGAVFAVAMAGGVFFAVSGSSSSSTRPPSFTAPVADKPVDKGAAWDGKSTLDCGMNETLVIENRTVTLEHETVIRASMTCKLTIRGSTLKGAKVIESSQAARIIIENSTLEGSQTAIEGSQLVELHVEKHSTIKSDETAIEVGQNSKVYLVDSNVEAKEVAIIAGQNSRIDAQGSKINGGEKSIKVGQNSRVVVRATQITGKRDLGPRAKVEER